MPRIDATEHGRVFGSASARLASTVTRLSGVALVIFGVFVLYAGFVDYGGVGSYELSLWALSVTFTESGVFAGVPVIHQITAFGVVVGGVGALIVLDSTRLRPLA